MHGYRLPVGMLAKAAGNHSTKDKSTYRSLALSSTAITGSFSGGFFLHPSNFHYFILNKILQSPSEDVLSQKEFTNYVLSTSARLLL